MQINQINGGKPGLSNICYNFLSFGNILWVALKNGL